MTESVKKVAAVVKFASQAARSGSRAAGDGVGLGALAEYTPAEVKPVIPNRTAAWREGKPEEDPAKVKAWGLVSAKPSEFLVCMRGGQIVKSGQGATCWKWPWETIAVVPTSVQKLHFVADQVTTEKVGVRVTGVAVYRIAAPLLAYRMVNFSFPERAQAKLAELLEEMFVGAVRRLVANLSVEACLTERKEAIASELMREIAPVVSGSGTSNDSTNQGWGVVLDNIEIQDVRVASQNVFAAMQAPFRLEQERKEQEAQFRKQAAVKEIESATARKIETERVSRELEARLQKARAEENAALTELATRARVESAKLEQERATFEGRLAQERLAALRRVELDAEVAAQKQAAKERAELDVVTTAARLEEARRTLELQRAELEARVQSADHAAKLEAQRHAEALWTATAQTTEAELLVREAQKRIAELESDHLRTRQAIEVERAERMRAIENSLSPEVIQLAVANALPQVAQAFKQNFGEVHLTSFDGGNPMAMVGTAIKGVFDVAKSFGLTGDADSGETKPPRGA